MKNHRKFKPYIRLATGRERTDSMMMAVRLAFYKVTRGEYGLPYYVMIQRGFPNHAMAVGGSKREIIDSLLGNKFAEWSSALQRRASGVDKRRGKRKPKALPVIRPSDFEERWKPQVDRSRE